MKERVIAEIPNTVDYFLRVINIRGEIVGVCDLRIYFNRPVNDSNTKAMIIFESAVDPIAEIVGKVDWNWKSKRELSHSHYIK